MKHNKLLAILIVLSSAPAFSQKDSLKGHIKKIIYEAIKIDLTECQKTKSTAYSMAIVFSKKSEVEAVEFITDKGCLAYSDRSMIIENIKKELNNLVGNRANKKTFANVYVLAIITIDILENNEPEETILGKSWDKMFDGIDEKKLSGKKIKYLIPLWVTVYPTIN